MISCSYDQLRDLLFELGFTVKATKPFLLFEHQDTPIRLYLEPYVLNAPKVDVVTLGVVRRNLDERGVLPAAEFEEMLRQRSLAG